MATKLQDEALPSIPLPPSDAMNNVPWRLWRVSRRAMTVALILFVVTLSMLVVQLREMVLRPSWMLLSDVPGTLASIKRMSHADIQMMGLSHDPMLDFGYAYENVEFPSAYAPELTLRGWHVPCASPCWSPAGARVGLIAVHGAGFDRRGFLRYVPMFHGDMNIPIVLYDSSGHGASDGRGLGVSYGKREHLDLLGACRYVRSQLGWTKVVVFGSSVGGSSVILAAAKDHCIDVVISENPFSSVRDLFAHAIKHPAFLPDLERFAERGPPKRKQFIDYLPALLRMIPDALVQNFVGLILKISGLGDLAQPTQVVTDIAPRPLFIIHSLHDKVIPHQQSHVLYERAKQPKRLWIADKGGHASIFNAQPTLYQQKISDFLEEALGAALPGPLVD